MAKELPTSVQQLLQLSAIPEEDQRRQCGICHEAYGSSAANDLAIELVCGHLFGSVCIAHWLQAGNQNCPMCLQQILNIPVVQENHFDEDAHWRNALANWRSGFVDEEEPSDSLRHGERLFIALCEEIVRYIEDPTIEDAEDWLCSRVPYRYFIALGTFEKLVELMRGPPGYLQSITLELRHVLLDPSPFIEIMAHIAIYPTYRTIHELIYSSAETYERLAGYNRRIEASRDALFLRLYGRAREV